MAFAVYRGPIDFARPTSSGGYKTGMCNGVSLTDDQAGCRTVTITAQNQTTGTTANIPVIILRPPVILIHGLWDNWTTWNNFRPLVSGPGSADSRFSVGRVNYANPVGEVVATDPGYLFGVTSISSLQGNSMGLGYNASGIAEQVAKWIGQFKAGRDPLGIPTNPLGIPAAAIQADIVGHSMGGLMGRELVLEPSFLSANTFGQGNIHKLITIDTPHLGSQVALQLLSSQENAACIQNFFCLQRFLALDGKYPLNRVWFPNGSSPYGAVFDLEGDDTTGRLSPSLAALNSSSPHPLPTALIAGVYQNFANLDTSGKASLIRLTVGKLGNDPLAQQLTSSGWPAIFYGNNNDAIVSENSQMDGLSVTDPTLYTFPFFGYVHSVGTETLGFLAPSVLDGGAIPNQVINLLNQPWTNPNYYTFLAP